MKRFIKSFRHAWRGIGGALRTERNLRIELFFAVAAGVLSCILPLSPSERATVFLTMGTVFSFEFVNTAFERLLDMLMPEYHEGVKVVKDIAAAAVLAASVFAVLAGLSVFLPHLSALFS
jgi:diacylglycerol kinase